MLARIEGKFGRGDPDLIQIRQGDPEQGFARGRSEGFGWCRAEHDPSRSYNQDDKLACLRKQIVCRTEIRPGPVRRGNAP
jgi:hypothetical protein